MRVARVVVSALALMGGAIFLVPDSASAVTTHWVGTCAWPRTGNLLYNQMRLDVAPTCNSGQTDITWIVSLGHDGSPGHVNACARADTGTLLYDRIKFDAAPGCTSSQIEVSWPAIASHASLNESINACAWPKTHNLRYDRIKIQESPACTGAQQALSWSAGSPSA